MDRIARTRGKLFGIIGVMAIVGSTGRARAGSIDVLAGPTSGAASGGLRTFVDDFDGFLAAAGAGVRTIDFETLPDGSPSYPAAFITPDFNYTDQGVTFSSPVPSLFVAGNEITGYGLWATSYPTYERTWIVAEFNPPSRAVGTHFFGGGTLTLFDALGGVLGSVDATGLGSPPSIAAVSDVPIALAIVDRGIDGMFVESLSFAVVPEPATVLLLSTGGICFLLYRNNRRRAR